MKLKYLLETAAAGSISAGAIAPNPFTSRGPVKRRPIPKVRKARKVAAITESSIATFDVSTAILFEYDSNTPSTLTADKNEKIVADVNNKVSNAVKRSQTDDKFDTTTFGLQDADGKIVKVTVNRAQSEDFESRLNSLLSDVENPKEIAEVLYMLKKDYEIVDVEWDEPITEDEEEDAPTEGGDEEDLDLDAEGDAAPEDGEEIDGEEPVEPAEPDIPAGTVNLLQQVIDLLKAETESRTANAQVATAKAETELVDVEHQKQEHEITAQQEIADMEAAEEEEKETKKNERLIQRIAKFRSAKQGGNTSAPVKQVPTSQQEQ